METLRKREISSKDLEFLSPAVHRAALAVSAVEPASSLLIADRCQLLLFCASGTAGGVFLDEMGSRDG